MRSYTHRSLAIRASVCLLLFSLSVGLAVPSAQAVTTGNLVVDPSFELNPLSPYPQIIGAPFNSAVWGAEVGVITGTTNGITPFNGVKMLEMSDDGNVTTQAFQFVDVTAYTASITAGLVTVDADAYFNVPAVTTSADGTVHVGFYNSAHVLISAVAASNLNLDSVAATWENIQVVSQAVPTNTQYILMQVYYANASLTNSQGIVDHGYVDSATLTLTGVPEPSSFLLAALGAVALSAWGWKRRGNPTAK